MDEKKVKVKETKEYSVTLENAKILEESDIGWTVCVFEKGPITKPNLYFFPKEIYWDVQEYINNVICRTKNEVVKDETKEEYK